MRRVSACSHSRRAGALEEGTEGLQLVHQPAPRWTEMQCVRAAPPQAGRLVQSMREGTEGASDSSLSTCLQVSGRHSAWVNTEHR